MKLKNYILTGCLSLVSAAALAWQKPAAPESQELITDGVTEQYFYNVGSGMFFVGGNDFETRASLSETLGAKVKAKAGENASFSTPEDFTSYITNPSFEDGNLNGWTVNTSGDTGVKQNTGTYECSNADGDYLFNAFDNYKGYPISQRLENLPNGIYKLQGMVTSTTTNVYLFANGGMNDANGYKVNVHKAVNVGRDRFKFADGEMLFVVDGGSITIGAAGAAADGASYVEGDYQWYKADNFRLAYLGNQADAYMAMVSSAAAEANTWFNDNKETLSTEKKNTLSDAISAAGNTAGKTVDELVEILKDLYAALAEAQEPSHYKIDESKLVTTAATSLDGVTVVVTDPTGTKTWGAFSSEWDGQGVDANCTSVYDWSSKSEYGYVKFFHVAEQADDVYYIKFVNADGNWYYPRGTWHDQSGSLNVTSGGDGLFVGGLTDKNGQDVQDGALWKVTQTAEGYTLCNVAKGVYAVPGIGVTSTETPLKLYTQFEQFEAYIVTLNDAGYATFSSSVNTKIATEGVKAYKASVEDETITLTEITGNIPAGTGVLLYGETAGTEVSLAVGPFGADEVTGNDLKATTKADGTLAAVETDSWALGSDNKFRKYTGGTYKANRAYLVRTPSNSASTRALSIVNRVAGTTSLENIDGEESANEGKLFENGNIVIIKNGKKYNLAGQEIK